MQRGLDLVGGAAGAVELKRELGLARDHAELRGVAQKRLRLDAVEAEIAGEGGHRFCRIEHDLAGGVPVIKLHAAERRGQDAVAEGDAERARAKLEMGDARLAHIEIDVGIEGGRVCDGRCGWSDGSCLLRRGLGRFGRAD